MKEDLIKALGLSIVLIIATLSLRPASEVLFGRDTEVAVQQEIYDYDVE